MSSKATKVNKVNRSFDVPEYGLHASVEDGSEVVSSVVQEEIMRDHIQRTPLFRNDQPMPLTALEKGFRFFDDKDIRNPDPALFHKTHFVAFWYYTPTLGELNDAIEAHRKQCA